MEELYNELNILINKENTFYDINIPDVINLIIDIQNELLSILIKYNKCEI